MKKSSNEALDAYYAEADSWAKGPRATLRAHRAAPPGGLRAAPGNSDVRGAGALLFLTPLKTVEPYTRWSTARRGSCSS